MTRTTAVPKLKDKGYKSGRRRYEEGAFPAYDKEYARLASGSPILNKNRRSSDIANALSMGAIGEIKGHLIELKGNPKKNGHYHREGSWYKAIIPSARERLKEVHAKFERWQSEQVRSGKALKKPTEWPDDLRTERLQAEAKLDICRRERAALEDRLEELKEKEGKVRHEKILPEGPMTHDPEPPQRLTGQERRRFKQQPWIIDGQRVSYEDGVPFIDCPDSPYNRMPVATYRKMARAWKKENGLMRHQLVKAAKDYREKAREAGEDLPPNFSSKKYKSLLKRRGDWPESPDWPEGAKPIDDLET